MKRSLLAIAGALFTVKAIAQSAQSGERWKQFSPPAGDTSVEFLREIFGNVIGLVATGGSVQNGGQQDTVLGSMMAVYCSAILFLGMLFVSYTALKATVNSAHDGEWLGRTMHSSWVPIRTVGGVALLLPLGSGFSLIQIGVMWAALQGVGVADSMWSAAIARMQTDNMITRPMIPDSRPLAANILRFEVCAAAMNKQFAGSGRSTRIEAIELTTTSTKPLEVIAAATSKNSPMGQLADSKYTVRAFKWRANDKSYINGDVCGGLEWKPSWEASAGNANMKTLKDPLLLAHATAVKQMILKLRPVAAQIVAGVKPDPGALDTAANDYENALRTAAKVAVSGSNDRARADFLKAAKDSGWIFAGTWYNHIAKMNDAMQSTLNGLPVSDPVDITDKETKEVLQTYSDAMTTADEYARHRVQSVRSVYYAETNVRRPQQGEGAWEYVRRLLSAPFMGAINQMTQAIAGSNLNHMSQMKSFGDVIVTTGELVLAVLASAAGATSGWIAKATTGAVFDFGAVLQFLSTILSVLVLAVLAAGVTLSTYVPMVPFITWTTSVVNWFVLVVEAVIAAPILAVAHIHPDGDDVAGKGGPGWALVMSLMMRPALMLFGLVTAMLLTEPITGYLNAAFMTVVAGVQADSLTGIVSFLCYVAIYAILMTSVVHIVFSLIHWIPDNILRWIGSAAGGLPGAENSGDKGHDVLVGGVRGVKHGAGGLGRGLSGGAPKTEPKLEQDSTPSTKDLLGS